MVRTRRQSATSSSPSPVKKKEDVSKKLPSIPKLKKVVGKKVGVASSLRPEIKIVPILPKNHKANDVYQRALRSGKVRGVALEETKVVGVALKETKVVGVALKETKVGVASKKKKKKRFATSSDSDSDCKSKKRPVKAKKKTKKKAKAVISDNDDLEEDSKDKSKRNHNDTNATGSSFDLELNPAVEDLFSDLEQEEPEEDKDKVKDKDEVKGKKTSKKIPEAYKEDTTRTQRNKPSDSKRPANKNRNNREKFKAHKVNSVQAERKPSDDVLKIKAMARIPKVQRRFQISPPDKTSAAVEQKSNLTDTAEELTRMLRRSAQAPDPDQRATFWGASESHVPPRKGNHQRQELADDDICRDRTPEPCPTPPLVVEHHTSDSFLDETTMSKVSMNFSVCSKHSLAGSEISDLSESSFDKTKHGAALARLKDFNDSTGDLNISMVDRLNNEQEEDEPMEWDQVDPGVLEEVHRCRLETEAAKSGSGSNWAKAMLMASSDDDSRLNVVIDTNVWISNLNRVERLLGGQGNAAIYVPWSVIRELDALKESSKVQVQARRAIKLLHTHLEAKNPLVTGQTGEQERAAEIYRAHNADDRILQACLSLKAQAKPVVLYTNDNNLANKALVSGINLFGSNVIQQTKTDNIESMQISDDENDDLCFPNPLAKTVTNRHPKTGPSKAADYVAKRLVKTGTARVAPANAKATADSCQLSSSATVEHVGQLFNDVGNYIYKYVCSYAHFLGHDLTGGLEQPSANIILPIRSEDCLNHLPLLAQTVQKLTKSMNSALRKSALDLSVTTVELLELRNCISSFLLVVDRQRPPSHQAPPDHPPISPKLFLDFILAPDWRKFMDIGLSQLSALRANLQRCLSATTNHNKRL